MEPKTQETKPISRRKLIQKVRRKVKKQNDKIAKSYEKLQHEPRSGLGSFLTNNTAEECDFDMRNHVSLGQNRKLKKKMRKLQKNIVDDPDKIFREMQKYKESFYRVHQKKLFNPVNMLEKRRQKRMKTMEKNAKKGKAEVLQKKLQKFQ